MRPDKDILPQAPHDPVETAPAETRPAEERAEGIPLRMTRSDPKHFMWLFDVKGSKESYRVKVKAVPSGNVSDINKVDIRVSCTCPFWRWQGPEHWAKSKDYLYGKPQGSATRPDVKDPSGRHGACKHVLAVLKRVSGFMWPKQLKEAPGKTASLRYLADRLRFGRILVTHEGMEDMIASVSQRYVRRVTRRANADVHL